MRDFWDRLRDHNQNARIARLEGRGGVTADELVELREQVAVQAGQIAMLRAVVGALTGTLRDALAAPGSIDASVLDARLEAAIEDVLAPPEVPVDPSARMVVCVLCDQRVPAPTTTMTAHGFQCDRCPPRPSAE